MERFASNSKSVDLVDNDDWIFEDLDANKNVVAAKRLSTVDRTSSNVVRTVSSVRAVKSSISDESLEPLKSKIKLLELKQQTDRTEKMVVAQNFHRFLILARNQIDSQQNEIRKLNQRLESFMSVQCPSCDHQFRHGDSRVLPEYVRYIKAANRLELEFEDDAALRRWLLISNLDTDKDGIPVIPTSRTEPRTLREVKSSLLNSTAFDTRKPKSQVSVVSSYRTSSHTSDDRSSRREGNKYPSDRSAHSQLKSTESKTFENFRSFRRSRSPRGRQSGDRETSRKRSADPLKPSEHRTDRYAESSLHRSRR
ncbi:hypothetical protein M3Y94_00466700 [Aphelenchoides besseyi]|nr:hypothetical protein M3Y94_00466700 [Aphelenchoides besseyi]KAI6229164.1 hypothetical protein M3Y95_00502500 [Aphelenchoides besseyi]